MFTVYLLPQGGSTCRFQIPCRLAGCVPGCELEINRYLPNWKYKAASCGSLPLAKPASRSFVGWLTASLVPRSKLTRLKYDWYFRICACFSSGYDFALALDKNARAFAFSSTDRSW